MSDDAGALNAVDHPGRRPATVWLHHGVGAATSWDWLLPDGAGGRRAVAYDRRGFGASPRPRRFHPGFFEEDADDLVGLMDARGAAPAHLVGHSDGGTVALLVAARRPDLVVSVTVMAAHVRGDPVTIGTLRRMGPPERWPESLRRSLARAHGPGWGEVARGWWDIWTDPAFERWSIEDELPRVTRPLLVVHDRADALSPVLHAETLAAAVPGARVSWRDTGTHDPQRGDAARLRRELEEHWTGAEAGAAG